MLMPTLLSTTPTHTTIGPDLHTIVSDYLPLLAWAAALMGAIWLTCTIIYLTAGVIAYTTFLIILRVTATCAEYVCRRCLKCAQLVTTHPCAVTPKITNLDHYRRRHQQHNHPNTPRTTGPDPDDAPA